MNSFQGAFAEHQIFLYPARKGCEILCRGIVASVRHVLIPATCIVDNKNGKVVIDGDIVSVYHLIQVCIVTTKLMIFMTLLIVINRKDENVLERRKRLQVYLQRFLDQARLHKPFSQWILGIGAQLQVFLRRTA